LHGATILTAIQAGEHDFGAAVGVQIVGPWRGEGRLFDFAGAVEEGLRGFAPPAGLMS
jgi:Asp-tRNA(Asn)/Glu-tRNA(Gln) amidotransferase A subunit family amidase